MKKSLDTYKSIVDYLKNVVIKSGLSDENFETELRMSEEMVEMLPAKIDKINAGMAPL